MLVLSTGRSKKKFLLRLLANWSSFWQVHFLLQLALAILFASSLFFEAYLLSFLFLFTFSLSLIGNRLLKWRLFFASVLFLSSLYLHPYPISLLKSTRIEGIFTPAKLMPSQKKGHLYLSGDLKIEEMGKTYFVQFSTPLPKDQAHFPKYRIRGSVKSLKPFKLEREGLQIDPLKDSKSLASLRFQLHQKMQRWIIDRTLPYEREGKFLAALFIGTKPDDLTKKSFAKNGLQHILAISGLHFGLFAAILSMLLFWIPNEFIKKISLLFILTLYFFLLSPSPSILRAYIASSSYLLASCLERKLLPINALGLGVVLGCILDPMSEETLSFELSFLATFAILLLYKPLSSLVIGQFKKGKTLLARIGISLHKLLFSHLALTLAASSMTIPLLLAYFHQFPMLSIYWNLFIPYLVGLGMTLFAFFSLLFPFFSSFSEFLIRMTCLSLKQILDLLEQPRSQGEVILSFDPVLMMIAIFFFAYVGILAFETEENKAL